MLSVTTLKALTIVRANQDILEMAFIAQVNIVTKSLIAETLTLYKNIFIHPFFFSSVCLLNLQARSPVLLLYGKGKGERSKEETDNKTIPF